MNQANSYGKHNFEDRDMSIILERKQLIFGRIEPQQFQQKVRNRQFFVDTAPKIFTMVLFH